jgi:hypothetical protein
MHLGLFELGFPTSGGMVFTRAARLRCKKVADYLCEIVQRILEVDSLYMEYEPVLAWHAALC